MSMNRRYRARKEALLAAVGGILAASARISYAEAFVSLSAPRTVGIGRSRRRPTLTSSSSSFLTSTRDRECITDDTMMNGGSFAFGGGEPLTANSSSSVVGRSSKSKSLTTTTSGIRYGPPPPPSMSSSGVQSANTPDGSKSLLERLTSLSTFASALCVLDCTVLPLITVALPLLGLTAAGGSAMAHTLHHLGHTLALYFVLPVGTFTTTVAYANHRSVLKCLPGILGLALIYLSNAGGASMHLHTATVGEMTGGLNPLVQMVPHDVLHAISDGDGWIHRVVNVFGCALMLIGNWWSKRTSGGQGAEGGGGAAGACFVPGCGRIECEVDGEGVDGIEEVSFFRVERPDTD